MDDVRVGLALRALRRRRGWRQRDVAARAGIAQTTVSLIERGHWASLSVATVRGVLATVDARLTCTLGWRGGDVDRLIDERHAEVVAVMAAELERFGWTVVPEATFNHFGDRGSIDLLAWESSASTVLVTEVKTEITSAEEMLRRLDVKRRLASQLAEERFGARPDRVAELLVVVGSTANRSRTERLEPLLARRFPMRGMRLRAWLRDPAVRQATKGAPGGIRFVRLSSGRARTGGSRRVRARITAIPATEPLRRTDPGPHHP